MWLKQSRQKIYFEVYFFMVQVALVALATNPSYHKELLSTVKSWPLSVYSALPVISAVEPQLNTSSMTDALKEVSIVCHVILRFINIYGFKVVLSFHLSGAGRAVRD